MHRFRPYIVLACCAIVLFAAVAPNVSAFGTSPQSVTVPASPVAESPDFATQVLRDPWDMKDYTDVSQYMNESGQRLSVSNPHIIDNEIFAGTSVSNAATAPGYNPYFFTLFPGYGPPFGSTDKIVVPDNAKIGLNYPIDASTYHCLYLALKTDSPAAVPGLGPDVMRVFWFADRYLNGTGGQYGMTYLQLYPEAGAGQPTPHWQLLKLDLASPQNGVQLGVSWNTRSTWQGLRIDPTTIAANVQFQVDWVRLTSCGASNKTITWSSDAGVNSVWVRPVGTTRNIRIATGVNGASGSAQVDTQGLAAGSYLVGVGTTTTCCSQLSAQALVINQAPIATFSQPSFYSGADYATNAGNPWDFSDAVDGTVGHFTGSTAQTSSYASGELTIVTPPGPLPAGIDVYINLNSPVPAPTSGYRYLTFHMYNDGPWQNVPEAMIGRWIWSVQGISGRAGYRCILVGPDIPLDVGWQTYAIDLYNDQALGGAAEDRTGECPSGELNWQSLSPVLAMRFDPNENVTGVINPSTPGISLLQKLDWIRLTKENQVGKGTPYLVQLALNKPSGDISTQTFYYTTSRSQPTQHVAQEVSSTPPSGSNRVYIPLLSNGDSFLPVAANPGSFVWDTSNVSPGTYYLCVDLDDGVNSNTTCSDAPVKVQ